MTAVLPFGSWPTPVTSELVVASASRVIDVRADGDDLVWVESRPGEGGRSVLVRRRADGTITELVGGDANVRTAVHEYGGGAWWVHEIGRAHVCTPVTTAHLVRRLLLEQ